MASSGDLRQVAETKNETDDTVRGSSSPTSTSSTKRPSASGCTQACPIPQVQKQVSYILTSLVLIEIIHQSNCNSDVWKYDQSHIRKPQTMPSAHKTDELRDLKRINPESDTTWSVSDGMVFTAAGVYVLHNTWRRHASELDTHKELLDGVKGWEKYKGEPLLLK